MEYMVISFMTCISMHKFEFMNGTAKNYPWEIAKSVLQKIYKW